MTVSEIVLREAQGAGRRVRLTEGQHFLRLGQEVTDFAVVLSGCLRVFTSGENGREITLYHVSAGECCMINVLSLLGGTGCPATAVVEEDAEAIVVPGNVFRSWMDRRADIRTYVFGLMATRVASMMSLVEEIAFQRLDCRLAAYLLRRTASGSEVVATHDTIAAELGTAREVVSRLLKSFERQGVVQLARGSIKVASPEFLRELAGG